MSAKPATPLSVAIDELEVVALGIKAERDALLVKNKRLVAALRDTCEQLRGDIRISAKESEQRARALLRELNEI